MNDNDQMITILGRILSRLVNVAIFIVITSLALIYLHDRTSLHLALLALFSILVGVLGTYLIRLLFTLIRKIVGVFA